MTRPSERLFDPDPVATPTEARQWIAECRRVLGGEDGCREVVPRVRSDIDALPRLREMVAPERDPADTSPWCGTLQALRRDDNMRKETPHG